MSTKGKINDGSFTSLICLTPQPKTVPNKEKMSQEDSRELELEMRKRNAEINRVEYEAEKATKDILINGFII